MNPLNVILELVSLRIALFTVWTNNGLLGFSMDTFMHLKFGLVIESDRAEGASIPPHQVIHLLDQSGLLGSDTLACGFWRLVRIIFEWVILLILRVIVFSTVKTEMEVVYVTLETRNGSEFLGTDQTGDSLVRKSKILWIKILGWLNTLMSILDMILISESVLKGFVTSKTPRVARRRSSFLLDIF